MIIGLGHDIIEIDRVRMACRKQAFLTLTFTEEEIRQSDEKCVRLAGDFSVKEALVKAFGTGFRGNIKPIDIEVLRNDFGAPYVKLYGGAKEMYNNLGATNIYVTISNTKELASSVVILEKE